MDTPPEPIPTPTRSGSPRASSTRDLDRIWARAYAARTKDDLTALYRDWAATYDDDHRHIGFFGHRRTAEVLARHLTRRDVARVLDAGAGTGAAGAALQEKGFRELAALDLSKEMLQIAQQKGVYRHLHQADLSLPIDAFGEDKFDAAVLVGVFSYGQAPKQALDEVLRVVRIGGVVAFTLREDFHAEDAMGVASRMRALERAGTWRLLERTDPEPYLPGKDPKAMFRVWCFRVIANTRPDAVEDGFEEAVREALEGDDWIKKIDHAWIWDSTASRLYDRYTHTDGYYLTDCEEEILQRDAQSILSDATCIVELGCGSARKIRHVLGAAIAGTRRADLRVHYLPIDVSAGALRSTTDELRRRFGDQLDIEPRQGMFEDTLPQLPVDRPKLVFFFGSSIGNLDSVAETVAFLRRLGERLGPDDRFVVGVDLHKDEEVLSRAYNEEEACRDFFVHMLRRINEHLGADFDPRVFELSSTYEQEAPFEGLHTRRVSLRVAPTEPQRTWVEKLGLEVALEPGQPVQVGISRKYEPAQIGRLAELAGLRMTRQWLDSRGWFSLNELRRADGVGDDAVGDHPGDGATA